MTNLLIVESPAKARTIKNYLGNDFKIVASFGHVRDLPIKKLGVDTEHDFKPEYLIIPKSKKTVNLLKKEMEKASSVYLATDYDREGEAIAWHIAEAVGLGDSKSEALKLKRITFHEITKEALLEALKHPRSIDMSLVDSQQARRILDRLVGYKLSPFLWKKVFRGLSAGRVQSVAVRLIVDREREIEHFKSEEYWTIEATLKKEKSRFQAILTEKDNKKIDKLAIKNEKEAQKILESLQNANYIVSDVKQSEEKKHPHPPYTTSTLQQDASHRLYFSAKKTMKLAQDLYEAGLITYMRTDSPKLAWVAINSTRKFIENQFGKNYLPLKPKIYRTKTPGAQEAHEAIRPTYVANLPDKVSVPTFDHQKLYDLIWRRMVACQTAEAVLSKVEIKIKASNFGFQANGQTIKFDGFLKVYPIKVEENKLPNLQLKDQLDLVNLDKKQHFTEPPPRYTEASLVKALEEHGIGRPSTYAPIISTIQERGYTMLLNRQFHPSEVGELVSDLLVKHFPDIVDLNFTANMEKDLDRIAEGKESYVRLLKSFYSPFAKLLEKKEKEVAKSDFSEKETKEKKTCPVCGQPMAIKMSRFGRFWGCSGYPSCKHTEQIVNHIGMKCPKCGIGEVIERHTRFGKMFYGCSKYPKCKFASWEKPGEPSTPVNRKSD